MTEHAVITGSFSECKFIKTRSACQLVIEIPIEAADTALKALGGVPQPGKEQPVAIARLQGDVLLVQPKSDRRGSLARQAGILCGDPQFLKFLGETYPSIRGQRMAAPKDDFEAAALVRQICGVESRSEFDANQASGQRWRNLRISYEAWKLI